MVDGSVTCAFIALYVNFEFHGVFLSRIRLCCCLLGRVGLPYPIISGKVGQGLAVLVAYRHIGRKERCGYHAGCWLLAKQVFAFSWHNSSLVVFPAIAWLIEREPAASIERPTLTPAGCF